MCGPCNSSDIGVIGHFDVLDGKNVRQAKFLTSTLAKYLDIARTGVLSSSYVIN